MHRPSLVRLLILPGFLALTASPGIGQQADDELRTLRQEVKRLQESHEALRRDLDDLKALLRARLAPSTAREPEDTLPRPVVLDVDGAPFLGSPDARVTVVEFSDFQCPFCARHSQQTLPAIVKQYVDAGKVRYVLRDFPIASLHPGAARSHEAAHCAGEQGRYWDMHQRLFANLRAQEAADLAAHAKALRLDVRPFERCLASERHAKRIQMAVEDGQRAGVRGTPTFFVGVSADGRTVSATRMVRGAQPYERFKAVIDAVLSTAGTMP